ncbi:DinB family protein [Pseudalkalibacillus decolorationis]|uniref:DinB family protein n=1 Tax=Pseudalkalibacillus decolorationis TaxID=163879 RepID=UPI0021478BC7|nr:DinB family protein [Pseudalkalibacillus decolorationis]
MQQNAKRLYEYHIWSNKRVMEHIKVLPNEVFNKEIQSVFPSISEVINHIYITDHLWLSVMAEEGFDQIMSSVQRITEETKGRTLVEMEAMYLELTERFVGFLHKQGDLDRPMTIEHPHYGQLEVSLSELIQHVVNHGTYHRGNVTAMLRQMGHAGVPTDYVFYLYSLQTK